jgi:hypothetical protein
MFRTAIFVFKKIPEWYGFYNRFEAHFTEMRLPKKCRSYPAIGDEIKTTYMSDSWLNT